ncbi:MAG: acetate--CoA ligase family protein [Desulfobacteraceae bacterium]|nr:acetate--CoA ligase family protein [Desulfobacteraceae bacterium]
MDKFFNPASVAVVGAGEKNLGGSVVKNLLSGFDGGIYPVNPNYKQLHGIKCYPSVAEIPGKVDLAVILVAANAVPPVLEACAGKGVKRVIIESAGFSETGDEGIALQKKCLQIARKAGMRLWGPNCMGLVDVHRPYFFTFMNPEVREELLSGRISLIVQSGMMSAIFLAELGRRGIGVAKACSIGNRADVDECDIIEYLQDDHDTDVIALYLESIPRGRRFAELARKSDKPLVLLKGGESRAGAKAAVSHTYSLSGDSRLLNSILDFSGVIKANSMFQMMDMAHALTGISNINPACRAAILTFSGGAGILACDALEKSGVTVAELSKQTRRAVAEIFPSWMPVSNPVDLFPAVSVKGRKIAFKGGVDAVVRDPGVDVVVIHFVAGIGDEAPDLYSLKQQADENGKILVFWLMGRRLGSLQFKEEAERAGILVYEDATRLAECISSAARFSAHREERGQNPGNPEVVKDKSAAEPLPETGKSWDEHDSKKFLAGFDIPVVDEKIVSSADEARAWAEHAGMPVVLKGLVPEKGHKTDCGLVKLSLSDRLSIESAFKDLSDKVKGSGRILIQKQVHVDYELIAGFMRDPAFGACVMFGLGGILAELEPDVVFELAPVDRQRALKMIRSVRNRKLFQGFRGRPPLDEEAAAQILVDLGRAGTAHPQISQIDINPLAVNRGSPVAVDAGVVLT